MKNSAKTKVFYSKLIFSVSLVLKPKLKQIFLIFKKSCPSLTLHLCLFLYEVLIIFQIIPVFVFFWCSYIDLIIFLGKHILNI